MATLACTTCIASFILRYCWKVQLSFRNTPRLPYPVVCSNNHDCAIFPLLFRLRAICFSLWSLRQNLPRLQCHGREGKGSGFLRRPCSLLVVLARRTKISFKILSEKLSKSKLRLSLLSLQRIFFGALFNEID